jgi:hypothetical protein
MARWRVESFEFESQASPTGARQANQDGLAVRDHDGQYQFWDGKTWICIPGFVNVYKLPKFVDGYYLSKSDGTVLRRRATDWAYWSVPHNEWRWLQTKDDDLDPDNLLKMGKLNGH